MTKTIEQLIAELRDEEIHTFDGFTVADVLEQLTARVRDLETQLAANNPLLDEAANRIDELEEENARLRFALADTEALELGTSEKLAASQLRETQLREALEFLSARIVTMDLGGVVERALAIPHDASAIDAYVAKRLHDMACDKGLLRIQVEELTRQRDLAVEALYESLECGEDGDWQSARRIIQSAIKESEAMAQGEKP